MRIKTTDYEVICVCGLCQTWTLRYLGFFFQRSKQNKHKLMYDVLQISVFATNAVIFIICAESVPEWYK